VPSCSSQICVEIESQLQSLALQIVACLVSVDNDVTLVRICRDDAILGLLLLCFKNRIRRPIAIWEAISVGCSRLQNRWWSSLWGFSREAIHYARWKPCECLLPTTREKRPQRTVPRTVLLISTFAAISLKVASCEKTKALTNKKVQSSKAGRLAAERGSLLEHFLEENTCRQLK